MMVFIKTYGCQMNERDSEMTAVLLQQAGYQVTNRENSADIIIINTCSVREKAEDKALGKLRLLIAGRKNERQQLIIGAVGCMVQRLKNDIFRKVPGLDFAIGPARLAVIDNVIQKVLSDRRPLLDVSAGELICETDTHLDGKASAFINILYGCNRHCAYCVVPEVRGSERSRPAHEIISEAVGLIQKGTKEIILLGQSILAYGCANQVWEKEQKSKKGFAEPFPRLLEALDSINGLKRLRFMSSHPSGCTDEFARAYSDLPTVCPHIHLPLQSGSDRILKLMNRGYTTDEYRAAVARIRGSAPNIAITTDIIVGFPSETKEDFDMTRAIMEEIGFSNTFIFKYSSRPGTKAAEMTDDVSESEKLRRNHIILEEQNRHSLKMNQLLLGRECLVLVEGKSKRNPSRWSGRTDTNILAIFEKPADCRPGKFVQIKIDRAAAQTLYGTPC
ncbi:MAG: tRNA (N6-isopentenyl adenosine(37)-C2)-methylthiotransferase MiaB [Kiritimatiellia bacterium]|nr:tRNA (N6-isopentenyl adenosine(37)-C2)-methylthiotransferase MiaB [Kiritimatiellia bacterium]